MITEMGEIANAVVLGLIHNPRRMNEHQAVPHKEPDARKKRYGTEKQELNVYFLRVFELRFGEQPAAGIFDLIIFSDQTDAVSDFKCGIGLRIWNQLVIADQSDHRGAGLRSDVR